ncbi:hypothetical protein BDZ45DRAFT_756012 [Acephala macrosclerotiorum]|nr:hypothetical protein BDZ45DRAFT_756012 [Acephala macrosclerotiorum]
MSVMMRSSTRDYWNLSPRWGSVLGVLGIWTVGSDGKRGSTAQIADGCFNISGPITRGLKYEGKGKGHQLIFTDNIFKCCNPVSFPANPLRLPIMDCKESTPNGLLWLADLLSQPIGGSGGVGHIVRYMKNGKEYEWQVDAIALCFGLHHTPNILHIDGIKNVPLPMQYSLLKGREQFSEGKDILIVGSGETGMDTTHLVVTANTRSVTLCYRDGLCATKARSTLLETSWFEMKSKVTLRGNIPIDVGAASLFDTAYDHPWLKNSDLPWWYYDRFVKWTT